MVQGTLYTYFDGVLVGDFTEFDTSAGNTNLAGIEVGAPWFANVQVDWVQASDSPSTPPTNPRSEEHTSELQSPCNLVCRLLLDKKKFSPISSVTIIELALFNSTAKSLVMLVVKLALLTRMV